MVALYIIEVEVFELEHDAVLMIYAVSNFRMYQTPFICYIRAKRFPSKIWIIAHSVAAEFHSFSFCCFFLFDFAHLGAIYLHRKTNCDGSDHCAGLNYRRITWKCWLIAAIGLQDDLRAVESVQAAVQESGQLHEIDQTAETWRILCRREANRSRHFISSPVGKVAPIISSLKTAFYLLPQVASYKCCHDLTNSCHCSLEWSSWKTGELYKR